MEPQTDELQRTNQEKKYLNRGALWTALKAGKEYYRGKITLPDGRVMPIYVFHNYKKSKDQPVLTIHAPSSFYPEPEGNPEDENKYVPKGDVTEIE